MGSSHFGAFHQGNVPGSELTAVCDTDPARLAWAQEQGLDASVCYASAENGQLVLENGKITFRRNRKAMSEFCQTSTESFAVPECWTIDIPYRDMPAPEHTLVMRSWVNAIRNKEALLCPGTEGIQGVELCNAILMSAWTGQPVDLPIDDDAYYALLQERIAASTVVKDETSNVVADLNGSF
ncbi:MAG: hypothetical protein ISS31_07320 [Kiritimatiellae bacterium]|nr:hypothetical protein [Kiritimatiellia bacterium]